MTNSNAVGWSAWSAVFVTAFAWSAHLMKSEDGWFPFALLSLVATAICLRQLHRTISRQGASRRVGWRAPVLLVLCGVVGFTLSTVAWVEGGRLGARMWHLIDAPISAANVIAPGPLSAGFARQFIKSTYCFPASETIERRHYVQLGTIAYALLFYVPIVGIATVRHRRMRGTAGTP